MMPFLDPAIIWSLVKIAFLFAALIYLVFAGVVVRQVYLMTTTLQVGFEMPVRALAWAHLFLAIAVFLFVLFSL